MLTLKYSRTTSDEKDKTFSYTAEFSNGWKKVWVWPSHGHMIVNLPAAQKEAETFLKLLNGYNALPDRLRLSPDMVFAMLIAGDKLAQEDKNWQEIILRLSAEAGRAERRFNSLIWAAGVLALSTVMLTLTMLLK